MAKSITTGTIFKFKLGIKGYGYGRIVVFPDILEKPVYLLKIYDYYGKFQSDNIQEIVAHDYLMNPLLLGKLPQMYGSMSWHLIGNREMPDDGFIPDFKYIHFPPAKDDSELSPWYPVIDFRLNRSKCGYMCVRHLERFHFHSLVDVQQRVSMEIIKKEYRDISRYFTLSTEAEQDNYYRAMNVPINWQVPPEIRARVLSKGRVPDSFLKYWNTNELTFSQAVFIK